MTISYEVGKRFPDERFLNSEGCVITFNELSFDVVAVLSGITSQELEKWKTGKFKYGLFIRESIPFLLIDFGDDFSFDCSFNFHKVKQENSSAWLQSKANLINLFLVDRNSYTTKAMRAIGLQPAFIDELKAVLTQQHQKYSSQEAVDAIIQQYAAKFTIDAMLKRSQLYQFG